MCVFFILCVFFLRAFRWRQNPLSSSGNFTATVVTHSNSTHLSPVSWACSQSSHMGSTLFFFSVLRRQHCWVSIRKREFWFFWYYSAIMTRRMCTAQMRSFSPSLLLCFCNFIFFLICISVIIRLSVEVHFQTSNCIESGLHLLHISKKKGPEIHNKTQQHIFLYYFLLYFSNNIFKTQKEEKGRQEDKSYFGNSLIAALRWVIYLSICYNICMKSFFASSNTKYNIWKDCLSRCFLFWNNPPSCFYSKW